MYGAILGDIIGSPYEFGPCYKTKVFPLFGSGARFTDDSVMTVAVTEALLDLEERDEDLADDTVSLADDTVVLMAEGEVRQAFVRSMQKWGLRYPEVGYGGSFLRWIFSSTPAPYGSWGNGSGMRVSSVGWLYETMEETRRIACLSAEVTHNHPEGIKGAEAIASAIYLARTGSDKSEIKAYIEKEIGYDLGRTCDEIRPDYSFDVSCQGSVPEAIIAFLEGTDFENVIRTAVSLGGDTDTIGAMAGSIAEAYFGVPEYLKEECRRRLPKDMLGVLDRFEGRLARR